MNVPMKSKCPVCGGELVAESSVLYLQAVCERCMVCLEFPKTIAHDVEEFDGVLDAHARRRDFNKTTAFVEGTTGSIS